MAEQTASLPAPLMGFARLPAQQKLLTLVLVAIVAAILVAAWLWSRTPTYAVLFSGLTDRDGGAIIASLDQQNVPYRFSEGGGAILVPAERVHDARLKLASQGLPKGGAVGFELMDTQKLGVSQFVEQLNYQRALEGELARSIQSLAAVAGARVHLAIPKQTGFLRDEQKPSASVLVNLHPGRSLEAAQVAGIAHLVSASVPQLSTAAVSVIDQNGALISAGAEGQRNLGLEPGQLKYVQALEASYVKRIEAILTPLTGPGSVRAQVSADVDFSQNEQTAETYKPNQAAGETAIRSQQSAESGSRDPAAAGVPGALSNQPPVPATAPLTAPAVAGAPGAPGATLNGRRESTINYEVDKTIRHTRQAVGSVKRLSVAVVVDHKRVSDAEGKQSSQPFSAEELAKLTALVKEAMGYDEKRGDTLNLANSPFRTPEKEAVPELPLWKDPQMIALAQSGGRYLLFGALAAWAFFGVIRPVVRTLRQRAEAAQQADEALQAQLVAGQLAQLPGGALSYDQKLAAARELAKQDPKLVANVIKDWVGGNER